MEEIILKAQPREVVGKQVKALRRQGLLPAVVYGRKFEGMPIVLDYRSTTRTLQGVTSTHLIKVDVAGKQYNVLVREKQHHPVTGALLHVDFQNVSMTEKLRVMVGLEMTGEAPAVKIYNGVIFLNQEELEIECLPGDLPEKIMVDISVLKEIGDTIYVRDLAVPAAVEVLTSMNEVVVIVSAPAVDAELEVVEPAAVEPEVIERGKKEEEF